MCDARCVYVVRPREMGVWVECGRAGVWLREEWERRRATTTTTHREDVVKFE